ncbi:Fc.00g069530.m01.CDS01 [Cosmosporella sp. VM-42]
MTPTPPSTNSSTGARSPEDQFRVVRKRNRVPLSCYPCRTRKKCDRNHPCSNCTKREGMDTTACSYATPATRKKNQSQGDSSPDDMQNRIDRLEGLVLSLMHGGANVDAATAAAAGAASQSITDSGSSAKAGQEDEAAMVEDDDDDSENEDSLATSLGFLKVDTDKGKSMYIGQEHWHTILADISEVKNYFTSHKKELETSYERVKSSKPMAAREGPTLLLGAVPASEIELRSELPPKTAVLTLCSRYFNSMDNAVNIIHGPTFQQQLRNHWQDPSKTPVMWLGLLYSVLCLAMLSYHKVGDEPPEWKGRALDLANEYRLRTVQCLIKSDYTKPVEYTVETMILYVFGEYSSRWDADLGLWLIVSLITRIAFRMGYHRDSKWFPSITPFQAEMRRRTWALVRMSDVIFSHQVSLPSMIYEHDCDTQLPNNIFDDEFYPGIKALPPSRPQTEPTPIAYMIAKSRLCNELGNILQATNRVGKHVPYDEIIRFDAKLRQVMQELPPHLKLTSLEGSHDPVTLIIARFNVDILYQKILCLLHRKYLPRARQNSRYAHSRRSAIEASLSALGHLAVLHKESRAHGRLRSVGWYVKSIATKDFILPAMLVILDLHFDNIAAQSMAPPDNEGAFLWTQEQRSKMIGALSDAREIWKTLADTSMEAFKATKIIEIMLEKIRNPGPEAESQAMSRSDTMSDVTATMSMDTSPALTQGLLSPDGIPQFNLNTGVNPFSTPNASAFMGMDFGMSAPEAPDFQADTFAAPGIGSPLSMFTSMSTGPGTGVDLTTNFDWSAFENYTQMANWGADQSFQIYGAGQDQSSPEQDSQRTGSVRSPKLSHPQANDRASSADIDMAGDSDYEPTLDDSDVALPIETRNPDGALNKKRKSPDLASPIEPDNAKRVRLHKDDPKGSRAALALGKDRTKQLPAEIWHHIFTYLPPKDLGRLLTINKLFHNYLSPSPVARPPSPSLTLPCILSALKPEVIWQASRRLWWPRMPAPLKGKPEYDMWRLACSLSCQFCSTTDDLLLPAGGDQWNRGPGAKGVSPIFPFSIASCGNCLADKSTKDIDVLLSSTIPSALLPALPVVFMTDQLHIIPPQLMQSGTIPPQTQVTKVFWSDHLEQIKLEFEGVKLLGSAAAEEWLKGLEIRGKQALNDASRWEKWYLSGGVHRMRTWKSLVPPPPDEDDEPDQPGPLVTAPNSTQSLGKPPQAQFQTQHQLQALGSNGIPGLPSRTDITNPQPRNQGQQRRTKEEVAELKAKRRAEIERRALLLDPPLTADVLAHIPSFQAALQITTVLDDNAWDILKPRLLAQRQEAEFRVRQNNKAVRTLQEKQGSAQPKAENNREAKTVSDEEWDEAQGPLRARISDYADEIISEGWGDGEKVTRKNSAQFAAEVLLYVRKRFYAEVAKDAAAAIAAGKTPIVDPPEGPWTQKLTLENMKWVFHFKIKPFTDRYRKDLFLCNDCEVGGKFYGLEAVVQHYAAKHTTTLSVGSIVVYWRTEWPEKSPFSPDPRLPEPGQLVQQPGYAPANGAQPAPSPAAYQSTAPPLYPTPVYGAPPPQFGYGQQVPFAGANPYGLAPYPTYPPQPFTQDAHHPSYPPRPPHGAPAHPNEPPLGYADHTTTSTHVLNGSYPNLQGYYRSNHLDGPYAMRLETMAETTKGIWLKVSNVQNLPPPVKVCVVIHHIAKRFQSQYSEAAPLPMFIDGLSNHKGIRIMRNTKGLACKACSTRHSTDSEGKTYSLPKLARHFNGEHVEPSASRGLQPLDWRIDMVLLPEMSILRGLRRILDNNQSAYDLVADTLPWAFEGPEPDNGVKRQSWPPRPDDFPPNGTSHEVHERHQTPGSDDYEPCLSEAEISRANKRTPGPTLPTYGEPERSRDLEIPRRATPHNGPPYNDDRPNVPDLQPASAVYRQDEIRSNGRQPRPHQPIHNRDPPPSDRYPGSEMGQPDPGFGRTEHLENGYVRPGSAPGRQRSIFRGDIGTEQREGQGPEYPIWEYHSRDGTTPVGRWEHNPRQFERTPGAPIRPPAATTPQDAASRFLDALEPPRERAQDNVVYVDPLGRELRKTAEGTYVYLNQPVPEPPRRPLSPRYDPIPEHHYPERGLPRYDDPYRPYVEQRPQRVYYDDPSAEAYELVEVRDPQGDYYIKRPVRRDAREYYPPEPRSAPREIGGYPAGMPSYEQPPTTRGSGYPVNPRAASMAPNRPPPRPEYEEYDPRYPAAGGGAGEPTPRHGRH